MAAFSQSTLLPSAKFCSLLQTNAREYAVWITKAEIRLFLGLA